MSKYFGTDGFRGEARIALKSKMTLGGESGVIFLNRG